MLAALDSLALLFLNGCATLGQGERLLAEGIPAVIATSHVVDDMHAQRFSSNFYRCLASGETIGESFRRAVDQAACFDPATAGPRDLSAPEPDVAGSSQWRLLLAESAEDAGSWSLPEAAGRPLFGLPPLVRGALPQQPFMGLRRFTAGESGVFFGRDEAIRNLYDDVACPSMPSLLVVYGASGAGKSSLLEAGLMPRLASGFEVHHLRAHGELDPQRAVRKALGDTGGSTDIAEVWQTRERLAGRPVVVCIDQLEALAINERDGGALVRLVQAFESLDRGDPRPQGKLILGLRKEWFPDLRDALRQHDMRWQEHFVKPLDRNEIEQVVLGPTGSAALQARYGIRCDPGLARRIANELSRDTRAAIAPMLQILLTRMWERTEPAPIHAGGRTVRHFTLTLYEELRREGLALRSFVDRQLQALRTTHAEHCDSGLVLDFLFRHTTSKGTAAVCGQKMLRDMYAHQREAVPVIVERCVGLYLLLRVGEQEAGGSAGVAGTRLAHDTLAPIIMERHRASKAPGQVAARLLDVRLGMGNSVGRRRLLDAQDLEHVEAARDGMRVWTDQERALVAQSRRRRRRDAWLQRGTVLLILGLMAAVVVTVLDQMDTASLLPIESRPAESPADSKPLLGVGVDPPFATNTESSASPEATLLPTDTQESEEDEATATMGPSPPESPPPVASEPVQSRRIRRPRCRRHAVPFDSTMKEAKLSAMTIADTGVRVALGWTGRRGVRLVEVSAAAPEFPALVETRGHVSVLAWSRDGGRLAIGQEGGVVQLVPLTAGVPSSAIACEGHSAGLTALEFSASGDTLVTADFGGRVIVRHGFTCDEIDRNELDAPVRSLAEDGGEWLIAGSKAKVMTWNRDSAKNWSGIRQVRGSVVVWDAGIGRRGEWALAAGRGLYSWRGPPADPKPSGGRASHAIQSLFVSLDGGRAISHSAKAVDLWRWDGMKWKWKWTTANAIPSIAAVAATRDRRDIFVVDGSATVRWFEARESDLVDHRSLEISPGQQLDTIAVDPERRYFVVADQRGQVTMVMLPGPRDQAPRCTLIDVPRKKATGG